MSCNIEKLQLLRDLKVFYHYKTKSLFWSHYYRRLREPKLILNNLTDVPVQKISAIVRDELLRKDFEVKPFLIDKEDYYNYLKLAKYPKFRGYLNGGKASAFAEKSLEHYIAAKLLSLSNQDVFVDIACSNSPASLIYRELYGCQVYRQDLTFPKGIHGNLIGSNASEMPIPCEFATKMALHCSFEHFEQNSDIGFIREAKRVLQEKGRVCIIPLYLFTSYAIWTNPILVPKNFPFEHDATLVCAKGFQNRHARAYDVPHLVNRIRNNLGPLKLKILVVENEKEVHPSCYVKFIALLEKE